MKNPLYKDLQYYKFSAYGFLKNLRFFEPFLILFFLEQGLSYVQIGTLYAVREIAVNLLEIPTGVAADAIGRKKTMVFSFLAYLISFSLYYFGRSMMLLVPATLLFSLGEAFRTGTHKAMIMAYLKKRGQEHHKNDYYGHTRSWSQVGSALSSIIGAGIVFLSGNYREIFIFSTIPYVLDLMLISSYPKELDGERRKISLNEIAQSFRRIFTMTVDAFKSGGAGRLLSSAAIYGGVYKGMKDYLQPLVRSLALSIPLLMTLESVERTAVLVGVIYAVLYLITSQASRFSYRVSRRFSSPRNALDAELFLGIVAALLVGVFHVLDLTVVSVALFFLIYIVQNLRRPVSVSEVSDAFAYEVQATALSTESQLQSMFAALLAFLVGAVAEIAGGSIGWGILVVSIGIAFFFPVLRLGSRDASA